MPAVRDVANMKAILCYEIAEGKATPRLSKASLPCVVVVKLLNEV